jgi:hypothetical protein
LGDTLCSLQEVLMPWRECLAIGRRVRFVAGLLDGEGMSEVGRLFDISRNTGCKRFHGHGGKAAPPHRLPRPARFRSSRLSCSVRHGAPAPTTFKKIRRAYLHPLPFWL